MTNLDIQRTLTATVIAFTVAAGATSARAQMTAGQIVAPPPATAPATVVPLGNTQIRHCVGEKIAATNEIVADDEDSIPGEARVSAWSKTEADWVREVTSRFGPEYADYAKAVDALGYSFFSESIPGELYVIEGVPCK